MLFYRNDCYGVLDGRRRVNGRLTERVDGNADTTAYTYDDVNRLININYPVGTPDVTFTYDELGNRLTMADGTGTITWIRDELYRPTSIEDGATNEVLYDYDEAGRLIELTYPGGVDSVVYGYDNAGRLETVTDWLSNVTTYTYDNANRLTSTLLGNGLTSDRTYDDADRLLSVENMDGMTPISTYDYTLDAVGNRLEMVEGSGTTTYTYDELYQLTDVEYPDTDTEAFTYDAMGNRLIQIINGGSPLDYTYDDADQMTDIEGTTYEYDDNGNQIERGTDTFTWDAENRLVDTSIDSIAGTYTYNGDGLRTSRSINAATVDYVWDLNSSLPVVLEDSDANRFVYGLDLLTRVNSTDEEWYLSDGLGSTTGLTDDTGDVTGSYTYDAFGALVGQSGDVTEWSFTGEQVDASGLQYLRARYYDSTSARFLSQDPLGGQTYNYVENNPIGYIDPTGLDKCKVTKNLFKSVKECTVTAAADLRDGFSNADEDTAAGAKYLGDAAVEGIASAACGGTLGSQVQMACVVVQHFEEICAGIQVADLLPYGVVPGLNIASTPASIGFDAVAAGCAEVDIIRSHCSIKKKLGLTAVNATNLGVGVGGQLASDLATAGGASAPASIGIGLETSVIESSLYAASNLGIRKCNYE